MDEPFDFHVTTPLSESNIHAAIMAVLELDKATRKSGVGRHKILPWILHLIQNIENPHTAARLLTQLLQGRHNDVFEACAQALLDPQKGLFTQDKTPLIENVVLQQGLAFVHTQNPETVLERAQNHGWLNELLSNLVFHHNLKEPFTNKHKTTLIAWLNTLLAKTPLLPPKSQDWNHIRPKWKTKAETHPEQAGEAMALALQSLTPTQRSDMVKAIFPTTSNVFPLRCVAALCMGVEGEELLTNPTDTLLERLNMSAHTWAGLRKTVLNMTPEQRRSLGAAMTLATPTPSGTTKRIPTNHPPPDAVVQALQETLNGPLPITLYKRKHQKT